MRRAVFDSTILISDILSIGSYHEIIMLESEQFRMLLRTEIENL